MYRKRGESVEVGKKIGTIVGRKCQDFFRNIGDIATLVIGETNVLKLPYIKVV